MRRLSVSTLLGWFLPSPITVLGASAESAVLLAPNLPMGDINVVVLTDVHSWVGGHDAKEPNLDADYGDVLSFYERLKAYCDLIKKDLFFVVNGDWIDGTGIATNGDPSFLIPLLEKMPWDAVNIGNHELYKREVIEYMTQPGGFVEWWGDRYLSSNIDLTSSMRPIGSQYHILQGHNSSVLTFGFLFNMKDNDAMVTVHEVATVVQQDWFRNTLLEEVYDAILVLAHMDVKDDLVQVIKDAIRLQVGANVPIQFVTGHTHYRSNYRPDSSSHSVEAGRYLDTVGFVSFPKASTLLSELANGNGNASDLFQHVFLDANVETLTKTLAVTLLQTANGHALSKFIARTRSELGLNNVIGCAAQSYFIDRSLDDENSLWRLFRDKLVPKGYSGDEVFLLGKGGWRYDVLQGNVTVDNVLAISPFNESLLVWKGVPSATIAKLVDTLNAFPDQAFLHDLPNYILAPARNFSAVNETYDLITDQFEVSLMQQQMGIIDQSTADITPVPMQPATTTTSVWINFFQSENECHSNSHGAGNERPMEMPPSTGADAKSKQNDDETDHQFDNVRLVFVSVAVAAVFLFSIINVRQRDRRWRMVTEAKRQLTLQALRDYEDEEGQFV
jgi:2',3'-cyclic-nucleotide 2'-phosphodiesterase (5'-nucleotidase family)